MAENNFDEDSKKLQQGLSSLKNNSNLRDVNKDRVAGERVFSEIVGGLIFGILVGWLIDSYFHTRPIFLIIFVFLGLAASVYNIYKATKSEDEGSEDIK